MCHFIIPIKGPVNDKFSLLKKKLEENNGNVAGDSHSGSFEITKSGFLVKGSYSTSNEALVIDISKKPVLVSCNKIKELIEQGLGNAELDSI